MDKVSIIVPVYNAAVFLPNTFESLRRQVYRDMEIILVNDCSGDNSLALCEKFAAEDNRVVIIDKRKNQGVDLARISGIEAASGDYYMFLDADDWLAQDAVESFVKTARQTGTDIVYSDNYRVFSQRFGIKKLMTANPKFSGRLIDGIEKDELLVSFFGVNIIPVTMWGALFKASLFKEPLKPSILKFGEDLLMSMQLYLRANSVYWLAKPLIYYRWGGVTAKFQPKFLESTKELYRRKMEVANEQNFNRAKVTATIELANCLASHVLQVAQYFPKKRAENIRQLQAELADEIYDGFEIVNDNPYFVSGNLNTLCMQRDAEAAYTVAESMSKQPKAKMRFWTKTICSKLLKVIRI